MKIPSKIKISGITYKIKKVKIGEIPPLMKNHADGQANYHECMIYLDSDLDIQRMFQVLLHEIIHIIQWNNNWDDELSENNIQGISSGLYQILIDNKLLKD